MGRKKKEGTVVVSVRMPRYLYNYFKKEAAKKEATANSVIVNYLESAACAKEKEEVMSEYKKWLKEKYKEKLAELMEKAEKKLKNQ